GKTTLAREWLASRQCAWYPASAASSDVAAFAVGIANAAAPLLPRASRRVSEWVERCADPTARVQKLADVVTQELSTIPRETWLAARLGPGVLLIETTGVELVREIRARGLSVPIVLISPTPERGFNENAREAGAQGTVLATGSVARLLATLRAVLRGELSFDAGHPRRPAGKSGLTQREQDVLRLVGRGATNR